MYTMSSLGSYSREGVIFSMSVPRGGGGGESIERAGVGGGGGSYSRKYGIQVCVSVRIRHVQGWGEKTCQYVCESECGRAAIFFFCSSFLYSSCARVHVSQRALVVAVRNGRQSWRSF